MGSMEEGNLEFLNMEQEDDNLLGISPANAEFCITGVSPLSPSILSKALKQEGTDDLKNCYGNGEAIGVPPVVGADSPMKSAPVSCRSPIVPSSGSKVLSALNFNEMNKRNVNWDAAEEFKSRKSFGIRESAQLDGIAETSPVQNPGPFTSQLSRSYLDIENEQAGATPEKGGGEPAVFRKSRSRRSTTLRKSLAWDKAFFTDEGVLDNDELFAVASDIPKTLAMPELATIWDGPQSLVTSFDAKAAAAKTKPKSEVRPEVSSERKPEVKPEVILEVIPEVRPEARPEVRPAVDPKPQQDVSHASLRPDVLQCSSLRPVRQIHMAGSHAFSNAYSRAAAIPQGSTSIPLPSSLSRAGKQPGVAVRHPTEHPHGTGPDQMKESRSTTAGLHHQARIAALKKAHEAPPQKGPRIRLPNLISNKKVEDKHFEETHKVKQFKKVENKPSEEVPKIHVTREKQPKKVQDKASEEKIKSISTHENHSALSRSMSTSNLIESPSALSRKVSSMSKRVKETLGKVMAGHARRVPKEHSLSHVHPAEKTSLLPKRSAGLPSVPEVREPNLRTRSNAAVAPVKVNKEVYTVRDILRGKGPPSSPKAASKQGPTLTRSKSAFAVPGLPRATDPGLARIVMPPAPATSSTPSALLPPSTPSAPRPLQPAEPIGKPTGLRKPSPKLGFFDTGRASPAPQKAFTVSQPFNCMRNNQPLRPPSEASIPPEALGYRAHGLPHAVVFSAIPTAPHLRSCVASAPTSPRSIHPSSPKDKFTTSTRPSSPTIEDVDQINFSGIRHAKSFAESHQLLAQKRLIGEHGTAGIPPEASSVDSIKVPGSLSTSPAVEMQSAELGRGESSRNFVESNPPISPAVNVEGPTHSGSSLESAGGEPDDKALIMTLREPTRSSEKPSVLVSQLFQNSPSKSGENSVVDHRHVSETLPLSIQDCIEDISEKVESFGVREMSIASNDLTTSSLEKPTISRSSSGRRHDELTKQIGFSCYSPRSSNFREVSTAAVRSCEETCKAVLDTDLPPSACPTTPTRKESSHVFSAKISRQFESPRSKSFREIPSRPNTASDSPAPANKHVRSFSQRIPWLSPGGKVVSDASPGVGPSTPASDGKRHSSVHPSYAPDTAGTFEVLTPSSSKNARCIRTPGSSTKKATRKIVEFESPSTQWSNWPVLGAAISADQLPGSGMREGLRSSPHRSSGEQAAEQLTELRAENSSNPVSTPISKASHAELDRAANEQCTLATEQSADSRLSFLDGFTSIPTTFAENECGSNGRSSSFGLKGAEVCGSSKKERGSSMFSFARKAVALLTSSPTPVEPSGQDHENTPKSLIKSSRRFSRSNSVGNNPATETKQLPLFSEARICELEAAGPEILQKKNGPVQNSPPDKVVADSNPWSPVRKTGQPLGPFDCTKLNKKTRAVQLDVLCMPRPLEFARQHHHVMHPSWISSCQWLGTRAGLRSKVRHRNFGCTFDFCCSFSC